MIPALRIRTFWLARVVSSTISQQILKSVTFSIGHTYCNSIQAQRLLRDFDPIKSIRELCERWE